MAHLRQEAALRLVLHPRLLGRLARAEAFLLERIDAVGEADGQGHQFHGHADLDHAAAEQAEQFEAQRGGGGDQERQQQRAPGQDVVEAVAQALAPDVDAGQQQAEGYQHHRQAGEDVPGAQPHQRLAGQQGHAGQQHAAEEAVEAREVAAGVEVAAAELDRHQAAQVHQQVDAGRLQRHVSWQQLEQQAVEAGGKQAEAEVVQQVPGVGGLAQRDEEEQVVAEQPEQHPVEGPVEAHQGFLAGRAGRVGAEVQRQVDGAAALHAQQQGALAGRQSQREPEVAHLHRALGEGEQVAALLLFDAPIGGQQVDLEVVQQRVVDLQETGQVGAVAVVQAHPEPPGRGVLAEVRVVAAQGGEGLGRQGEDVAQARLAAGVAVVLGVCAQGQAQVLSVQRCGRLRPGRQRAAEQQQDQAESGHATTPWTRVGTHDATEEMRQAREPAISLAVGWRGGRPPRGAGRPARAQPLSLLLLLSSTSSTGGTWVQLSMCTGCSSCLLKRSSEVSRGLASLAKTGGLRM